MLNQYLLVSVVSGVIFLILDVMINANPLARRLYAVYTPIMRTTINPFTGVLTDLVYGFVLAALFFLLYDSLPGSSGLIKGLSFALIVWFLRVAMNTVSQWMMFNIPLPALFYGLVTGLAEMLVLGLFYGMTLNPLA